MRTKTSLLCLFFGVVLIGMFVLTDLANSANYNFLIGGTILVVLGIVLLVTGSVPPEPSPSRFRLLKKIMGREEAAKAQAQSRAPSGGGGPGKSPGGGGGKPGGGGPGKGSGGGPPGKGPGGGGPGKGPGGPGGGKGKGPGAPGQGKKR